MEYKINGNEFKTLEVSLAPGETFYSERGSIVYTEAGLTRNIEFSNKKNKIAGMLKGLVGSVLSGESIRIIRFNNPTPNTKKCLLSGTKCAILPNALHNAPLICRRGCYIASTSKIELSMQVNWGSMLGGLGFFQKIEGEGTVFLDTMGIAIEKELGINDSIEVDETHLVALQGIQAEQIQAGWSIQNVLRGEGLSLLLINGPGKVYLSPLSLVKEE